MIFFFFFLVSSSVLTVLQQELQSFLVLIVRRNTDFKRNLVSFSLPSHFPPFILDFSVTFIKLSLSSEGWENFSFKKESLPTSQFYIFPQALNSLIFFPFKMRKSLARNWLDVRTGASGSSNLSDSFNKPIRLSGLLHIEQDLLLMAFQVGK